MKVDKQIEKRYREELIGLIQEAASNRTMLESFLDDLLTPSELTDLAARIQIVKQLKAKVDYRKIARNLHVGLGTVNRGANVLENAGDGFNRLIK